MRDYSNMPVLILDDTISIKKAIAQVHHAEPVIVQLAQDFDLTVDTSACGCKAGRNPSHHIDCNASLTIKTLAEKNNIPGLKELADIAHEAGQVVDIETDKQRIIIHD